ncbi:phospholipid carrier-dependent glycosyltransferase [bacterium]|nr:phospholipid carrier-dependent glycosyltransferase [bacterium]
MRQEVVWVLMLALGLRIGAALAVQSYLDRAGRAFLIPGDANGYWELGQKIANGEPYSAHDPPRRVMRMPGYPVFLALSIKLFGKRLIGVRLLQACVGTLACWFVFLLGRRLVNERTGLLAAALAAAMPTFIGFGALALTETLFAATLLGSLLPLATLTRSWAPTGAADMQRARWTTATLAGVCAALAVYVRPSWLLVVPGFCVLHCLAAVFGVSYSTAERTDVSGRVSQGKVTTPDSSQTLPGRSSRLQIAVLESVAIFVGLAIALLPWTLRNRAITGHPIVTTLWVGPSLYDGLNPDATGDSDMRFFERDNLLRSMSEYDMDCEYRRRAWAYAGEHPSRAVSLGFAKLLRYWKPWPNAEQFRSWWMCAGMAALYLPVFGGAAIGVWKLRHDLRCLLLTAAPILYFAAIHSVFVGSLRYRLPAEYPLLILTAAGLLALMDRFGFVWGGTAGSPGSAMQNDDATGQTDGAPHEMARTIPVALPPIGNGGAAC